MLRAIGWGLILGGVVLSPMAPQAPPLERLGRLDDPAIVEASGIVRSRKHPGIFWVHNDSGQPAPPLFAVRRDGSLVRSYRVEAPNVDWEDIATDDAGRLYIGDIGNNKLRLPLRALYRIDEPDPSVPGEDKPLKPTLATLHGFPAGGRFDAEGLFIRDGRAFVVSKRHDGKEAEVFAIPLEPAGTLARPNLPRRVASLPGCVEPATGADLSGDGRWLAVVTTTSALVYQPDGPAGWTLVATVGHQAPDVEAIAWDGPDLILASEDRSVYRIAEKVWRKAAGGSKAGRADEAGRRGDRRRRRDRDVDRLCAWPAKGSRPRSSSTGPATWAGGRPGPARG